MVENGQTHPCQKVIQEVNVWSLHSLVLYVLDWLIDSCAGYDL